MNRLTEIANRHKTDKGTEHYEAHGYTEMYSKSKHELCISIYFPRQKHL